MSRIAEVIRQVEAGEPVDWPLVGRLQALDTALAGEEFVAEAKQIQEEADEQLRQFISR